MVWHSLWVYPWMHRRKEWAKHLINQEIGSCKLVCQTGDDGKDEIVVWVGGVEEDNDVGSHRVGVVFDLPNEVKDILK